MKVFGRIVTLLKRTVYNNPDDERLFVYRDEKRKWLGVDLNFGHPKAGRCLLWCLGWIIFLPVVTSTLAPNGLLCLALVTLSLLLVSWGLRQAFRIAEYGVVKEGRRNYEPDFRGDSHTSVTFLLLNLGIVAIPLLFVCLSPLRDWIFVSCLAIYTLGHMVLLVFRFFKDGSRKPTTSKEEVK